MSRNATLILGVILFIGVYAYLFTDWFHPPRIQITAQPRPGWSGQTALPFKLDGKYSLTDVKVVPLQAVETNKPAAPVWHLVRASNAAPTSFLIYGQTAEGLKPARDKLQADPLEPDTAYHLSVEAGRAKGELNFRMPPAPGA
jgi:hypothetical protein